jgi:hypothetical protein
MRILLVMLQILKTMTTMDKRCYDDDDDDDDDDDEFFSMCHKQV